MRHETFESEFGRLGYVSYLFVLRLQSEALPIMYAFDGEPLLSRSGSFAKSTIGLRRIGNEDRIVLRLAFRKNTRAVTIALRPCFCDNGGLVPRSLCPIHSFWAAVTAHTRPGGFLFPTLRSRNVTRILRRSLANAGVLEGNRYTPHCFRRGIANEILRSGSTLATIMRAGGWSSGGYRAYLELHREEELNIQNIFSRHNRPCNPQDDDSLSSESSAPLANFLIWWVPSFQF